MKIMEEIRQTAYRYAVKNAFEHQGKARVGAVVGKVKALFPEADLREVMPVVNEAVLLVNKLDNKTLDSEYLKFSVDGWELKHIERGKKLPELDWLKPGERIITRVAPNPSGVMHFGHARPAVLTDEYVKKYGGKFILRFDDTDPKIKIPIAGVERDFIADFNWLGIKFNETMNASDHLQRYYEVIEQLIINEKAYVCECQSELWRELTWESKSCPCRGKSAKVNIDRWKKMLKHELKEGEAVVRIKTNLNHHDPSIRDWWLARVVDKVNHPNKKAKDKHVWPSYNLASAVDDHDMGINLVIRGQEHISNEEKQKYLYAYFNWTYPNCYYHGKVSKLGDMTLSKSKIKEIMDSLGAERYDDPRMATIKSFRRRGFTPQAIRKVILDCGLNLKEVKITLEMFAAVNKKILGEVNEYAFFVEPIELEVTGVLEGTIESYGEKIILQKSNLILFVEKKELLKYKDKSPLLLRLKKGFNIQLLFVSDNHAEARFVSYDKKDLPVISWIKEMVDAEILMNDGKKITGIAPKSILKAKGVVHFEGLGYVNIEENKKDKVKCVYSYK